MQACITSSSPHSFHLFSYPSWSIFIITSFSPHSQIRWNREHTRNNSSSSSSYSYPRCHLLFEFPSFHSSYPLHQISSNYCYFKSPTFNSPFITQAPIIELHSPFPNVTNLSLRCREFITLSTFSLPSSLLHLKISPVPLHSFLSLPSSLLSLHVGKEDPLTLPSLPSSVAKLTFGRHIHQKVIESHQSGYNKKIIRTYDKRPQAYIREW